LADIAACAELPRSRRIDLMDVAGLPRPERDEAGVGTPDGRDLEFADELTLGRALSGRRVL
jgi:hypothetical protein